MRTPPIRIALAGAGMISWHHLVAWRNLGPRARVLAISDPDLDRGRRRAEEFGIPAVHRDADAMLGAEKIDALDVASPRETHAAWVEAAAARGIDVLCQKPLAPTLAEAQRSIDTVPPQVRAGVLVQAREYPERDLRSVAVKSTAEPSTARTEKDDRVAGSRVCLDDVGAVDPGVAAPQAFLAAKSDDDRRVRHKGMGICGGDVR